MAGVLRLMAGGDAQWCMNDDKEKNKDFSWCMKYGRLCYI